MIDFYALRAGITLTATDRQRAHYLVRSLPRDQATVLAHAIVALGLHLQAGHSYISLGQLAVYLQKDSDLPTQRSDWQSTLEAAPDWLIGSPHRPQAALILHADKLYFQRIWQQEQQVAAALTQRLLEPPLGVSEAARHTLDTLFPAQAEPVTAAVDWQRVAAACALTRRFCLISGGPGTGKTRTVTRILATLVSIGRIDSHSTALAAPTGKAAGRLNESMAQALSQIEQELPQLKGQLDFSARTVHSLLGTNAYNARTRHHAGNPLPYRLVVIDEASMLDLSLLHRLLAACTPETQLIFLGDRDQLPSVGIGDTLGQLFHYQDGYSAEHAEQLDALLPHRVPRASDKQSPTQLLADHAVMLRFSHRFSDTSGIGQLAKAINHGHAEQAIALLQSGQYDDVHYAPSLPKAVLVERLLAQHHALANAHTPAEALAGMNAFQLLVAKRKGPWGVNALNAAVEAQLVQRGLAKSHQPHYHARPILIGENAVELGIYNGDTGIVFDEGEGYFAYFQVGGALKKLALSLLPAHESAFAMTIHKSQGSEFKELWCLADEGDAQVGLRSLLYTAVTRAKQRLTLIGEPQVLTELIRGDKPRASQLLQAILKYGNENFKERS